MPWGSPPAPGQAPTLQRQLALPVLGLVSVLVLTGAIAVGAVLVAGRTVNSVTGELHSVQDANLALLDDAAAAETGLRNYALTGRRESLTAYRQAREERTVLLAEQARAVRSLGDARDLQVLVEAQRVALRTWDEQYALKVAGARDATTLPPTLFNRGEELFTEVRAANAELTEAVQDRVQDGTSTTQRVLTGLLVLVALVTIGGVVVGISLAQRMSRELVTPLTNLVGVLGRLRAGDTQARASAEGPQEIRDLASALNTLTEENLRGRDVEVDVLSRLEELDRVRNDLVSTVSHELRTPLTSIKGYLELLQDQMYDDLSEMQLSMLGTIRRNLDRLTELISNLLALSRAEETTLNNEPLDLRGIATEVASDVRVTAAVRDITVRTVLPSSPVILVGDRSQLLRAVSNLASNAVKFSRPGGTVELRVTEDEGEGVIEVVDEGIGIPASDLPGLGSRFYRASNAVKAEIAGTGLGLRIVQTILDRHEGTLLVESVEGEGTMAVIRLPLRRVLPVYREALGRSGAFDAVPDATPGESEATASTGAPGPANPGTGERPAPA